MNPHLIERIDTLVDSFIVQQLARDAEGICTLGGTVEEVAAFIAMKRTDYKACKDELLARVIVDATGGSRGLPMGRFPQTRLRPTQGFFPQWTFRV